MKNKFLVAQSLGYGGRSEDGYKEKATQGASWDGPFCHDHINCNIRAIILPCSFSKH